MLRVRGSFRLASTTSRTPSISFSSHQHHRGEEEQIWRPSEEEEPSPVEMMKYQLNGRAGDAEFNVVLAGYSLNDCEVLIAAKLIVIPNDNEEVVTQFRTSMTQKVSFLYLPHPNLTGMLFTITKKESIVIYYERFPDDVFSLRNKPETFIMPKIKRIFHQILSAVAHYHHWGVIIGDLRPPYLQLTADMNVKLADFGFAGVGGDPWKTYEIRNSVYSAPELLFGSGQYSMAADIWSVGCIVGELVLLGIPVFQGEIPNGLLNSIFSWLGRPNEESWPQLNEICSADRLASFSSFEPGSLALKFPGFEPSGLDLLSRILVLNPQGRISAADALDHEYFADLDQ